MADQSDGLSRRMLPRPWFRPMILAAVVGAFAPPAACQKTEWSMPKIVLPQDAKHPLVACTPDELARLRAAYRQRGGPARAAVARVVARAGRVVGKPVVFPPRGGQHNQWYQCEKCQLGLKTLDDTHHQCPGCKKVYTGPPYDDVIFASRHGRNLRGMSDAAWAYAITGQPKYARHAADVLLGYAARYRKYPFHDNRCRTGARASRSGGRLHEQTLGEASSMATLIAPAYDLIAGADVLSPDDRAAIRDGLIAAMLKTIDGHKAGKSNWQTWHNAAMLAGGAVIGDVAWVRKALTAAGNGFAHQMKVSVTADGMWYENSWGYHFYTLRALVLTAEYARRLDIDLWSHPAMKKMFLLPAEYTMADGSLPRFGDDVRSSVAAVSGLMEAAYGATKDPAIEALLPAKPGWEAVLYGRRLGLRRKSPPRRSAVFGAAGHAILRSKGPAGLSAAMTFGPYGGFHGHFDKLSFVLFAHRRELGVDPGRAASQAYRLPIHGRWYKATLGHNAVIVDAASQKPAAGRLEIFGANATHAVVAARCDAAYPGVAHRRVLVMAPAWLLVFDDLAARKPRRFDWVYHNRGQSVACPAATAAGKLARSFPGSEFVRNIKTGRTSETVRVVFADKSVTTRLTVAPDAGTEVRVGDGPGASVLERVPVAMVTRRNRRAARFAAVIEPVAKGDKPAVTDVSVADAGAGIRITVRQGRAARTISISAEKVTVSKDDGKVLLTAGR